LLLFAQKPQRFAPQHPTEWHIKSRGQTLRCVFARLSPNFCLKISFLIQQIRHGIKNNTVDKLKQILTGLNEDCAGHYAKSGKKQELIDRIVAALDSFRLAGLEDKWLKAKAVIYQVRTQGT